MKQFEIQLFDGHPIIKDGENIILIDTGSPVSIHSEESLYFCSKNYSCNKIYMGLTVTKISDLLGTKITTLLGADILSDYKILFDYRNCIVGFSKEEIIIDGVLMNISNFMRIPIIHLSIGNQIHKLFLDTGAKLSYLSDNLTCQYKSIGIEEDFYPGIGKFTTDCFEIPTNLGEHSFIVKYGKLPLVLQSTLSIAGTVGIVGLDFFNNFRVVLNLEKNQLQYAN